MISIMFECLFEDGVQRRLPSGQRLFLTGDAVQHMHFVLEGEISLIRQTNAGARMILQQARAGQILAEASAYSPIYHCDAYATADSSVRCVPAAAFRGRLAQDPALSEQWAAHLAHAVQSARMRAEIRTLRTIAERLDAWLGPGRPLPERGRWQELAAELGVTREALYRELAKRRPRGPCPVSRGVRPPG